MSETTTTTESGGTALLPQLRRMVTAESRNFGVPGDPTSTTLPSWQANGALTVRGRAIMTRLLKAIDMDGRISMTSRRELGTSANMMQQLWLNGWVNGAGSRDERGLGNTPDSSWWWLTTNGEAVARAVSEGKIK